MHFLILSISQNGGGWYHAGGFQVGGGGMENNGKWYHLKYGIENTKPEKSIQMASQTLAMFLTHASRSILDGSKVK